SFFSSRRRHTRSKRDWSSDVCSSDLAGTTLARGLENSDGTAEISVGPCSSSPRFGRGGRGEQVSALQEHCHFAAHAGAGVDGGQIGRGSGREGACGGAAGGGGESGQR